MGDDIEISPGVAEERSGKYSPITTKVASLGTGAGMAERVGPGGLIALGTALDPRLTKGDVLVGNLVGKPGGLPPIRTHITVDLQLFDQAVGSSAMIKVDKVRATETLRLNIGTASSRWGRSPPVPGTSWRSSTSRSRSWPRGAAASR